MARLTDIGIARLNYDRDKAPSNGRIEIPDHLPGLVLRVTENVKSFCVFYRVQGEGGVSPTGRLLRGKQRRITLGDTPPLKIAEARDKANDILAMAAEGRDPRQYI